MIEDASARLVRLSVREDVDVYRARSRVRSLAMALGFSSREIGELVIVASELAWNIIKHAERGMIEIGPVEEPDRGVGLCILARDNGPPFHDFQTALIDGHDDRGPIDPMKLLGRRGIGGGLGAVTRFTDRLSYSFDENSKCIAALRFLRRR